MDMPPTRYRVVERGRRLEVIDTRPVRDALAVPRSSPLPTAAPRSGAVDLRRATSAPLTLDSRGNRVIATAAWYDAKGPRRITVTGYHATNMAAKARTIVSVVLFGWLIASALFSPLWLLPLVLAVPRVRRTLRVLLTLWLDKLDQASTASSAG